MSKQDKKELRQQIACEWLEENYLNYGSLRHDVVRDRLQIRVADLHSLEDGSAYCLEFRGKENWRNLTDKDINTMVCQCVNDKDTNISTTEMWTAIKSDMVPAVHPLSEYEQPRVYKRSKEEIDSAKRIGASDALMQRCDVY